MKKIALLAVSVAIALTGCGGSDGDSDTPSTIKPTTTPTTVTKPTTTIKPTTTTKPTTATIKVIDGYLSNADVCINRNKNSICDKGEKLLDTTNSKGEINVSNSD